MSSEALHRRSYENESNNWVPACRSFSEGRYFDDLKTNYQKSKIVQSNNYYPFGLQTKDSWTRIDTKPNQYLYNAGSELNVATSNYDMMFRSYDPAIGRMSGVDPMVNSFASLTPYNYSFNDPVFWNDPSGAIADGGPNAGQRKFGPESGNKYEDCSCGGSNDMYGNGGFTGVGTYYFGGLMFVVDWGNGTTTVDAGMDSGFTPVTYFSNDMAIVTDSRIVYEDLFSSLDTWNEGAGSVWRSNRGSSSHYRAMGNEVTQAAHAAGQAFAENPFGGAFLGIVTAGPMMGMGGLVGKAALSSRVISAGVDLATQVTINSISAGSLSTGFSRVNWTSVAMSAANPKANLANVFRNSAVSSAFELRSSDTRNILNGGKSFGDVAISVGISGASYGLIKGFGSLGNYGMGYSRSVESSLSSNGFAYTSSAMRSVSYIWAGSKVLSVSGSYGGFGSMLSGNLIGN